jgi:N utilization substance protein A
MKNEFVLAFNEVLEEKGLPREIVIDALQAALASAYRRHVNASNAQHVDAAIDPETGSVTIYAEKEVVDVVEDPRTEVELQEAQRIDQQATIGSMVIVESTPKNFGRVAAQTARQVIQQRIREAERDAQFNYFSKQLGEVISGVVQAVNAQGVTLGLEMKAEGTMPRAHMIPGERFRVHDRDRALLLEIKSTPRGPQILLSRAHRNFLRRLLENEVPEIYHGMVEIRSIAREPGQRSKVAVAALQTGVDPVGACVGIRGVRIQAIVRELNDEKIDVIEWSQDPAVFIAKALSPARVSGVYLNEHTKGAKTATVVVPEDQLSLAIGRDGQNARLAAKLTSWRIDIKSLPEAATDSLYKLQNDPDYAVIAEHEVDIYPQVEVILAKKAEGRPVTPEEYHLLTQFVDRVERGLIRQLQEEVRAEEEREREVRAEIPEAAFDIPLEKFEVSDRVYAIVSETGLQTVGDLILLMRLDPDSIWRLSGIGPKAMHELEDAVTKIVVHLQEAERLATEAEQPEPALEAEGIEKVEAPEEILEVVPIGIEEVVVGEEEAAVVEAIQPEVQAVVEELPLEPKEIEITEPVQAIEVEAEEEPSSLDEIFALRPEVLEYEHVGDEDEDEEDEERKKKKKRKKSVEVEYDPDKDVMVAKKKHKRSGLDWDSEW